MIKGPKRKQQQQQQQHLVIYIVSSPCGRANYGPEARGPNPGSCWTFPFGNWHLRSMRSSTDHPKITSLPGGTNHRSFIHWNATKPQAVMVCHEHLPVLGPNLIVDSWRLTIE